jgi:hypothetical protein
VHDRAGAVCLAAYARDIQCVAQAAIGIGMGMGNKRSWALFATE